MQGDASTSPEFQRLRAAIEVLTRKPKPRHEDVSLLCSSWIVRQREHQKRRPLATLITELQQAVVTEGNRLRRSFDPDRSQREQRCTGCGSTARFRSREQRGTACRYWDSRRKHSQATNGSRHCCTAWPSIQGAPERCLVGLGFSGVHRGAPNQRRRSWRSLSPTHSGASLAALGP